MTTAKAAVKAKAAPKAASTPQLVSPKLVSVSDSPTVKSDTEMDEEIAEYWDLWSEQIGRVILPVLQELAKAIPTFNSAMVCTGDGFNLCTIGVDESATVRLSALTSSMHSMADAVSQAVHNDDNRRLDRLTLTNGDSTTVVLAIRSLIIGQVLLWVTADAETLGALLVRCDQAAASIRKILEVEK
jgi:predicted regulator of Ras-like GTPase activity (Roadblock/LC7/MglB family)